MRSIKAILIIILLSAIVLLFNGTYIFAETQSTEDISVEFEAYSEGKLHEFKTIEKNQKLDWNLVIAFITFLAATAAAYSALISKKHFEEELKPAVVWKAIMHGIEDDVINSKYKAHIKIINYGKGLAYIREITSKSKDIGIHIGTPITLGESTEGELTLIFDKNKIDSIIKQCQNDIIQSPRYEDVTERRKFDSHGFEVELLLKNGSFTLSRNITFDLYYWNIKKECFRTYMDLSIRIDIKHYQDVKNSIDFQCFINNETVDKYDKRNFPSVIIQHESHEVV